MTSVSVDALLRGLGANMSSKAPKILFPEECFSALSLYALEDPKTLMLMSSAIKQHAGLLHPELLLKFLQNANADLNVIGALLVKSEDRRFAKIVEFCRAAKMKSAAPARTLELAARIGQSRFDKDFGSFGIQISEFPSVDDKKISSLPRFMRASLFVKNRVQYGCNWRADVISCIQLGFPNPSEIKKRLRCSYETAHRVFTDYMLLRASGSEAVL